MKVPLIAAALALAMSFPAHACEFTLPDTVAAMTAEGQNFVVLDEAQRTDFLTRLATAADELGIAHDLTTVTEVLILEMQGEMFFGLVREDGCLTPPVSMAAFLPQQQISGVSPSGKIGA